MKKIIVKGKAKGVILKSKTQSISLVQLTKNQE